MADPIFVQPHFDDVALSCGGTVAKYAANGVPKVVTIFGGEPTGNVSDFVRFQHERWQFDDREAVRSRQAEDQRAIAQLGDTVEIVWFDYLDAIYRRSEYASDEALFGELVPEDLTLVEEIAGQLALLGDRFVVPMAVGRHVDHQLIFQSGKYLSERGKEVWCFADQPYALDPAAFNSRLDQLGNPSACVRLVSGECFERRWEAIEQYRSQLPVIFRSIEDPRRALAGFGRAPGDDSPVELFWRVDDTTEER